MWSRPMFVNTAASGAGMTFVASNSPPMPTSHTTMSQRLRRNQSMAMAVTSSNSLGWSGMASACARTSSVRAQSASSGICSPSTWIRSLKRTM